MIVDWNYESVKVNVICQLPVFAVVYGLTGFDVTEKEIFVSALCVVTLPPTGTLKLDGDQDVSTLNVPAIHIVMKRGLDELFLTITVVWPPPPSVSQLIKPKARIKTVNPNTKIFFIKNSLPRDFPSLGANHGMICPPLRAEFPNGVIKNDKTDGSDACYTKIV